MMINPKEEKLMARIDLMNGNISHDEYLEWIAEIKCRKFQIPIVCF